MSPTLYQTDLRIINHRRQKSPTVIYAPFIQNSNQLASRLTATTSFPRVFFQLLQFSRQRPSFSAHMQGCSDDKNWLDFSSIFFETCIFRSSILLFTITTEIHARSLANLYCQYADGHINLKFMRTSASESGQFDNLLS